VLSLAPPAELSIFNGFLVGLIALGDGMKILLWATSDTGKPRNRVVRATLRASDSDAAAGLNVSLPILQMTIDARP
jgi:hypothetical protein